MAKLFTGQINVIKMKVEDEKMVGFILEGSILPEALWAIYAGLSMYKDWAKTQERGTSAPIAGMEAYSLLKQLEEDFPEDCVLAKEHYEKIKASMVKVHESPHQPLIYQCPACEKETPKHLHEQALTSNTFCSRCYATYRLSSTLPAEVIYAPSKGECPSCQKWHPIDELTIFYGICGNCNEKEVGND